jgi:glutamate dehydrogenase
MTTRSVRAFSKGIMRRLGLDETKVTKFITGGPDGDLGSNEIKFGREIVVGVADGSGVLYDPNGIDDKELKVRACAWPSPAAAAATTTTMSTTTMTRR